MQMSSKDPSQCGEEESVGSSQRCKRCVTPKRQSHRETTIWPVLLEIMEKREAAGLPVAGYGAVFRRGIPLNVLDKR